MAMNNELLTIVQYIERERGVGREIVLTAIEGAIQQAARRNPGVTNDLRVSIDRKNLNIHVYDTMVASNEDTGPGFISLAKARKLKPDIQNGDTIEIELPASRLGRVAAQTSRQVIMQKIREAERANTLSEYRDRTGEIVSGTVTSVSRRDVYVQVGKTEMLLPGKERIPQEEFQVGDPVRAIIHKVDENAATGPSVTLSRACPEFVKALFRLEVSEITDGIVEIVGVSRDPGFRSKLAVRTLDEKVDPVGACVGLRGIRVRDIVRELGGEKIDIVRWNPDIRLYVAQALQPAKLESVEIDPDVPNTVRVVVAPDQYSLALGKRGQNVRLTTKLTGWHVDVVKSKAKASFEEQMAEAIRTLAETFDVDEETASKIAHGGFLTVDGILASDVQSFAAATGLDDITAQGIFAAAQAVAEITAAEEAGSDEE